MKFLFLKFSKAVLNEKKTDTRIYPRCRKTPCFSYGDIRHFMQVIEDVFESCLHETPNIRNKKILQMEKDKLC